MFNPVASLLFNGNNLIIFNMKRCIFIIGVLFFASMVMQAQQVSEKAAKSIAAKFMKERGMGTIAKSQPVKAFYTHASSSKTGTAYYVFNAKQNKGFVIVSGDKRTKKILGYSDNGHFDEAIIPDNMRWFLSQYVEGISSLNDNNSKDIAILGTLDSEDVIVESPNVVIKPLMKTVWGQSAPYNLQCPKVGSKYCFTGCTATAMAQIMFYNRWPKSTSQELPGYTNKKSKDTYGSLPPTSFSWKDMKTTYSSDATSISDPANAAVAKLMRYCGQSVDMEYGVEASGAYCYSERFVDYFNYSTKARTVYRYDYSGSQWKKFIISELQAKRPVFYDGYSKVSGHAFVCDGYDGKGYFHFNWGWSGYGDGYYLLSSMTPTGPFKSNYEMDHRILIGLEPSTMSTNEKNSVAKSYSVYIDRDTYTRSSSNESFEITVTAYLSNISTMPRTYDLGWGVYKSDGHTLLHSYTALDNNVYFKGRGTKTMTSTLPFGKDLANGTYYLRPISRESGNAKWSPCHYSGKYYIEARIKDNKLTLFMRNKDISRDPNIVW